MNNILKIDFYDEFNCTADQCSFTCCKGWEILVDTDTYTKWNENANHYGSIRNQVKFKKENRETVHYIKMGASKCCPFLDPNGLCSVVIQFGEVALPKTCKTFPRQENNWDHWDEYSFTCACPAVVDIIYSKRSKIVFSYDGDENALTTVPPEYNIREAMIGLMQNRNFSLRNRILLVFHMLFLMKDNPDIINEILLNYQEETYLLTLLNQWNETTVNYMDSLQEMNELFLDIVQNYQYETTFRYYLKDIANLSEDWDTERIPHQWNDFDRVFDQYDQLMENCIVLKIFNNCISDDIEELILAFQIIITEYVMVKYSVFLKWLITGNGKMEYTDVRDYLVVYSRIIGYNMEGIIEFWEDSFEEAIWELEYLLVLI